jgi:hypothetical protein
MRTAQQYRAKAAEFRALLADTVRSPDELRELRGLEQTYTTLAENEEWMEVHLGDTVRRRNTVDTPASLAQKEE